MTLITNTESLKEANSSIVHDLQFDSIKSFVDDASLRDVIPAIGRETYLLIGAGDDDIVLQIAGQLAKKAEANLAIAYYTNFGSVKLNEDGAQVMQGQNTRIASDKKIAALVNQSRLDGYRAVDLLIEHVEMHAASFPAYHIGMERAANRALLITSTKEFNDAVFIDNNPLLFRSLKSYIRDAETEHILPVLGDEYFADLHGKVLANNCNDIEVQLLKIVAKVTAEFAIAEAIPYRAIALDANGIFTNTVGTSADGNNAGSQSGADSGRLASAMNAAISNGNKSLARLRRFISKNKDALTGCPTVDLNSRSTLNNQPRGFFFA